MQFSIYSDGSTKSVHVVTPDGILMADQSHPNIDKIIKKLNKGAFDKVPDLFNTAKAVQEKFKPLSRRISVRGNDVYFEGDVIDDVYADHIVSFIQEGHDDWKPLVTFLENVYSNVEAHTRDNLSRWLHSTGGFEITDEGLIVGYKGVREDLGSITKGPAIVDGQPVIGNVPNQPGSTIEMARSEVEHNPAVGCARGLHVGTWNYASGFGKVVLRVLVHPADVVSVPTDCSDQKMRVSRYVVDKVVNGASGVAYAPAEDYYDSNVDDDDYDEFDDMFF